MQHIRCNDITVEHRINHSLKHAYLHVETDGKVILKSNGKNINSLKKFIKEKESWIIKQRKIMANLPIMLPGKTILFFGKCHNISSMDIHIKDSTNLDGIRKQYDQFYKLKAEAYCLETTERYAEHMCVKFKSMRFRKMRRRWGSCSKEGIITFNTLLMQLPKPMIDYTIVHELAHLVHFNHSKAFHAFVAEFIPEEQSLRKRMRDLKAILY